jgi:hypothetical protein
VHVQCPRPAVRAADHPVADDRPADRRAGRHCRLPGPDGVCHPRADPVEPREREKRHGRPAGHREGGSGRLWSADDGDVPAVGLHR